MRTHILNKVLLKVILDAEYYAKTLCGIDLESSKIKSPVIVVQPAEQATCKTCKKIYDTQHK